MIRLEAFAGLWRIAREIEDFAGGPNARFAGEARFTPGEAESGAEGRIGGLWMQECGTLRLGESAPMLAERRYFWTEPAPGSIAVYFDDLRPFHGFTPGEGEGGGAAASHDCAPDRYEVRYDFAQWPLWRAEWRVRGPRKDYLSRSTFTR